MNIKLNDDKEIVKTIKEGLKKNNGYCPCRVEKNEDTKCMNKLQILILKDIVIVCYIINQNKNRRKKLC